MHFGSTVPGKNDLEVLFPEKTFWKYCSRKKRFGSTVPGKNASPKGAASPKVAATRESKSEAHFGSTVPGKTRA
jgi:hypothetical protein